MAGFQNEEVMTIKTAPASWSDLNVQGEDEATRLITEARDTNDPMLIIGYLRRMPNDGLMGVHGTGFITRLCQAAMNGI